MIIIILIAIDIHELAHAVVADRLGDPTPRRMGELSLNPFVHMDQVGVILLLLTSITGFGFTYGRTHVTPSNLKWGAQRGNAVVAIAGPLSNLVLAALCGVFLTAIGHGTISLTGFLSENMAYNVEQFIFLGMILNILLFVLNLIPLPPLDGFTVLAGFLTARQMYSLAPVQQWGPFALLLIFLTDPQTGILSSILNPAISQIGGFLCSSCSL
jgi:Zn-dependent protease